MQPRRTARVVPGAGRHDVVATRAAVVPEAAAQVEEGLNVNNLERAGAQQPAPDIVTAATPGTHPNPGAGGHDAAMEARADVVREAAALVEEGAHIELVMRAGGGAQQPARDIVAAAIPDVHPERLAIELDISRRVEEAERRAKVPESRRAVPHLEAGLCDAGAAPREPTTEASHMAEQDCIPSSDEDVSLAEDEDENDRPAPRDDGDDDVDYGRLAPMTSLGDYGSGNSDEEGYYEPARRELSPDDYEDESDAEAAAPDEDELEKLYADGTALSKTLYGENTPKKRARSAVAKGVWVWIKRLKKHWALQKVGKDYRTHVCTRKDCWRLVRMTLDSSRGIWQTTNALTHDREYHKGASAKGDESAKRRRESSDQKQTNMFDFAARGAPGVGAAYALKKVDAARAALARSYIYSRGTLSKSSFDDPAMRERDQALFEAGGGTGKAPFLTRRGLVTWVRAEYAVFCMFARQMMLEGREYSNGNPFCQGLNDGATLKNKEKNLAVGLEFIDPKLLQNHTICLGMVRVLDGTNNGVARKVEEVSQAVLGHSYGDVSHSTIADFAAIGVCSELDHEEEGCDMHDDDKLGRAAVGDLVRSRKKVVVNPFDECQAILTKVKDAAVYFTYDSRRKKLETYIQLIPGGCANVRLKTDLNKTRVAARYGLIYSVLRMSKVLKLFAVANPSVTWKLTDLEWETVAEIEAVLRISGEVTTIVQTEQHYMGALGRCIHVDMLQKYRAEKLWVIDLENVSSSNVLPRKPKSTFDGLTVIGAETLRRGLLEAERRHCGNKTEVVSGSSNVVASDREDMAMLLDPRTM